MVCHEKFANCIRYAYETGVTILIPTQGYVTIRPYLAVVLGDKPAIHAMMAIKHGNNCKLPCHLCIYQLEDSFEPHDKEKNTERDYELILQSQTICGSYLNKLELGELDQNEINTLRPLYLKAEAICDFYGAHPFVTSLIKAPLGYDNALSIFVTHVRDIFHDLEAGLFPSIIMMCLRIVLAISTSKDVQYRDAIALLDHFTSTSRLCLKSMNPNYQNQDHADFMYGCASIILKTAIGKADVGATGSMAGMRCAWSKPILMALLIAFTTSNGSILPDREKYVFQKTVTNSQSTTETVEIEDNKKKKTQKPRKKVLHTTTKFRMSKSVNLKNPMLICSRTIALALDLSAEFKRTVFNEHIVEELRQKVLEFQSCFIVLHQVMVAVCRVREESDDYKVKLYMRFSNIYLYY